jgi:hypothetical protein
MSEQGKGPSTGGIIAMIVGFVVLVPFLLSLGLSTLFR